MYDDNDRRGSRDRDEEMDGHRDGTGARGFRRRRGCTFCGDKAVTIDYQDTGMMLHYVSEHGRVVPRRISGTCAKHQRELTTAIKRARMLALLPYTSAGA